MTSMMLTGCSDPVIEDVPIEAREAWFRSVHCKIEEKRKFTQEEYDTRREKWPANLARDLRTNKSLEGCADG